MKPYIPILLGTGRKGRKSERVARFVFEETKKTGVRAEFFDARDFATPATVPSWENGKKNSQWKKIMAKAAGLIIVSPEYNHGYPGELKIILDGAFKEYAGKPMGVCGVSGGPLGGARMVEQLRQVAVGLNMLPVREVVYFADVENIFSKDGKIKDEFYREKVKGLIAGVLKYIK